METARQSKKGSVRKRYSAPDRMLSIALPDLLIEIGRAALEEKQLDLLRERGSEGVVNLFYSGDIALLRRPCVSIVGTRDVSEAGWIRASRLARELAEADVTVVSGLAKGVDTAAIMSAVECGGVSWALLERPLTKHIQQKTRRCRKSYGESIYC